MAGKQFDTHEDHIFLKRKTKLAYGMAGFGQAVLEDVVNNFMLMFYNISLHVPARWVGWAFSATRLWDAFSDPLMGNISDNTRSRWGRRRPYILIGSVFFALSFVAMCIPPEGLSAKGLAYYLGVTAFFYFTFYTVTVVPVSSLGAELTLDYHERTRLQAYRSFLNRSGAAIGGACWWLAGQFDTYREGFLVVGIGYAILSVFGYFCTFIGTREDVEIQQQEKVPFFRGFVTTLRNGPFWMLAGMVFLLILGILLGFPAGNYIVVYYVFSGDANAAGPVLLVNTIVFNATSLLSIVPITWLGVRFGKERTLTVGMFIFASAPLLSWFIYTPEYPYLQVLFQIPVAFAFTTIITFMGAMLADLVDLDELVTEKRREGSYASVLSFLFKLASPVGVLGAGYLIDYWAKLDPELTTQTPETILRLRLMLLVVPLIPCFLAAVLAFLYPIREQRVREVRMLLEERRAQRLQAQHMAADAERNNEPEIT